VYYCYNLTFHSSHFIICTQLFTTIIITSRPQLHR